MFTERYVNNVMANYKEGDITTYSYAFPVVANALNFGENEKAS